MLFLFSKSKKIGSKIIRWGLGEPVSHFAMVFDESPGGFGLLFHSHFGGVSLEWFNDWQKTNEIVFALAPSVKTSVLDEEKVYQVFVNKFYSKEYDLKAMAYWAYVLFRYKYLNEPIPSKNAWGEDNKYLCYEIAEGFKDIDFMGLPKFHKNDMISPYQLKCLMDQSDFFTDISHLYRG